ncbi:fumarylacetoacetate hydrolase family protein [Alienimonas californiensis]|uniref:Ureidoglycolate lyase n=1 Tax=Alienimonas californiensis TaxID=2527989 RepID=A0A517P3V2_9PLAN|nr:fumarylacetoacetate hydrolase family protein [Alienimonas californiensis]QDT14058.1 Ureidoglycolate lyase [Alienimonas californiensis]
MKLATLHTARGPRVVAMTDDDRHVDLNLVDSSLPTSLRALLALEGGLTRAAAALANAPDEAVAEGKLLAPIPDPGKVICIGLNYRDHAEETNSPIPSEPVVFGKFGNTIRGPEATVTLPAVSEQVDYEAELVVVIGRTGKNVAEADAMNHVAGYMNGNDVSARDWQKGRPGEQWLLGKTPDGFAPTGPFLLSADEAGDPHDWPVKLELNGRTMQDGSTADFLFTLPQIVAHLTKIMTLEPGDLIFTGTPAGVGAARKPPAWITDGSETAVTIGPLGTLRTRFVAE